MAECLEASAAICRLQTHLSKASRSPLRIIPQVEYTCGCHSMQAGSPVGNSGSGNGIGWGLCKNDKDGKQDGRNNAMMMLLASPPTYPMRMTNCDGNGNGLGSSGSPANFLFDIDEGENNEKNGDENIPPNNSASASSPTAHLTPRGQPSMPLSGKKKAMSMSALNSARSSPASSGHKRTAPSPSNISDGGSRRRTPKAASQSSSMASIGGERKSSTWASASPSSGKRKKSSLGSGSSGRGVSCHSVFEERALARSFADAADALAVLAAQSDDDDDDNNCTSSSGKYDKGKNDSSIRGEMGVGGGSRASLSAHDTCLPGTPDTGVTVMHSVSNAAKGLAALNKVQGGSSTPKGSPAAGCRGNGSAGNSSSVAETATASSAAVIMNVENDDIENDDSPEASSLATPRGRTRPPSDRRQSRGGSARLPPLSPSFLRFNTPSPSPMGNRRRALSSGSASPHSRRSRRGQHGGRVGIRSAPSSPYPSVASSASSASFALSRTSTTHLTEALLRLELEMVPSYCSSVPLAGTTILDSDTEECDSRFGSASASLNMGGGASEVDSRFSSVSLGRNAASPPLLIPSQSFGSFSMCGSDADTESHAHSRGGSKRKSTRYANSRFHETDDANRYNILSPAETSIATGNPPRCAKISGLAQDVAYAVSMGNLCTVNPQFTFLSECSDSDAGLNSVLWPEREQQINTKALPSCCKETQLELSETSLLLQLSLRRKCSLALQASISDILLEARMKDQEMRTIQQKLAKMVENEKLSDEELEVLQMRHLSEVEALISEMREAREVAIGQALKAGNTIIGRLVSDSYQDRDSALAPTLEKVKLEAEAKIEKMRMEFRAAISTANEAVQTMKMSVDTKIEALQVELEQKKGESAQALAELAEVKSKAIIKNEEMQEAMRAAEKLRSMVVATSAAVSRVDAAVKTAIIGSKEEIISAEEDEERSVASEEQSLVAKIDMVKGPEASENMLDKVRQDTMQAKTEMEEAQKEREAKVMAMCAASETVEIVLLADKVPPEVISEEKNKGRTVEYVMEEMNPKVPHEEVQISKEDDTSQEKTQSAEANTKVEAELEVIWGALVATEKGDEDLSVLSQAVTSAVQSIKAVSHENSDPTEAVSKVAIAIQMHVVSLEDMLASLQDKLELNKENKLQVISELKSAHKLVAGQDNIIKSLKEQVDAAQKREAINNEASEKTKEDVDLAVRKASDMEAANAEHKLVIESMKMKVEEIKNQAKHNVEKVSDEVNKNNDTGSVSKSVGLFHSVGSVNGGIEMIKKDMEASQAQHLLEAVGEAAKVLRVAIRTDVEAELRGQAEQEKQEALAAGRLKEEDNKEMKAVKKSDENSDANAEKEARTDFDFVVSAIKDEHERNLKATVEKAIKVAICHLANAQQKYLDDVLPSESSCGELNVNEKCNEDKLLLPCSTSTVEGEGDIELDPTLQSAITELTAEVHQKISRSIERTFLNINFHYEIVKDQAVNTTVPIANRKDEWVEEAISFLKEQCKHVTGIKLELEANLTAVRHDSYDPTQTKENVDNTFVSLKDAKRNELRLLFKQAVQVANKTMAAVYEEKLTKLREALILGKDTAALEQLMNEPDKSTTTNVDHKDHNKPTEIHELINSFRGKYDEMQAGKVSSMGESEDNDSPVIQTSSSDLENADTREAIKQETQIHQRVDEAIKISRNECQPSEKKEVKMSKKKVIDVRSLERDMSFLQTQIADLKMKPTVENHVLGPNDETRGIDVVLATEEVKNDYIADNRGEIPACYGDGNKPQLRENESSNINATASATKLSVNVSSPRINSPLDDSNGLVSPCSTDQFTLLSPLTMSTFASNIQRESVSDGSLTIFYENTKSCSLAQSSEKSNLSEAESKKRFFAKKSLSRLKESKNVPGTLLSSSRMSVAKGRAGTELSGAKNVHLMFIGIPSTDRLKVMAMSLGINITDDPMTATHIIPSDGKRQLLRRTPKLMVSLCRTSNILYMDWLLMSYKEHKLLDCHRYLVVNDHAVEKQHSFCMKQTLKEGKERRKEGGLLASWQVLFCEGVAGNKAPKEEDLNMIVQAAGGSVIKRSDLLLQEEENINKVLVITSDPAHSYQISDWNIAKIANDGPGFRTTSWLFGSIMLQKLIDI